MMDATATLSSHPVFVHLRRDDTRWIVREDCTSMATDTLFYMLHHHEHIPNLTLIKENNVRASFFLKPPEAAADRIFIKRYKQQGWVDRCKHLVLPAKAVAEWRNMQRFAACGLPVPRPIALGIRQTGLMLKDSCLMTEALLAALPVHEFLDQQFPLLSAERADAVKKELTVSLARLAANVHNAGFFYRDLHAGNILIKISTERDCQLFLIDLHRAWRPFRLLRWMRFQDLAQLWNSVPALGEHKRLFVEEYLLASGQRRVAREAFTRKLEAAARRLEQRRVKSRSKRCLVNSTTFEVHKTAREQYFGRREFGRQTLDALLQEQAQCLAGGQTGILKKSENAILTKHVQGRMLSSPVCVKHYFYRGMKYAVKSAVVKSRALKSWAAGHMLLVRGVGTPLPLALLERKYGPFIYESFLVTEWLADALPLNDYVINLHNQGLLHEKRERFIQALAETLRDLHEKGIYHADLKSTNILVRADGPDLWRFYFIDLERVKCTSSLTFRERANNLAQINASVARCMSVKDRLKFFRVYAKDTQLFKERKKYYQEILKISRTKNTEPFGVTFTL